MSEMGKKEKQTLVSEIQRPEPQQLEKRSYRNHESRGPKQRGILSLVGGGFTRWPSRIGEKGITENEEAGSGSERATWKYNRSE